MIKKLYVLVLSVMFDNITIANEENSYGLFHDVP